MGSKNEEGRRRSKKEEVRSKNEPRKEEGRHLSFVFIVRASPLAYLQYASGDARTQRKNAFYKK
ncbi:MAG: hypothetical protein EAZ19_15340 [Oscillatoriales cyanobacterium]|nr:MAG: hypothetical protein EAZ45_10765 [Oscillatoriales cyanobacterium]TAG12696.1 MAG: hypothetical protein EAZ39_30310 [Oscillatoriales cyanobacterium]TAG35978.1 MAG: hypothetical protein EAZ33_24935 [Oscillatoriales cyanobacterium]TAG93713.1 MAG: hypothetical protein EAZ19_15340 [Oscillatoriales cyanobacterium]